jgi:hypothetical protein
MASGPQHYRLAEIYGQQAEAAHAEAPVTGGADYLLQQALLHATLANTAAAAQAMASMHTGTTGWAYGQDDYDEWAKAVSTYENKAAGAR